MPPEERDDSPPPRFLTGRTSNPEYIRWYWNQPKNRERRKKYREGYLQTAKGKAVQKKAEAKYQANMTPEQLQRKREQFNARRRERRRIAAGQKEPKPKQPRKRAEKPQPPGRTFLPPREAEVHSQPLPDRSFLPPEPEVRAPHPLSTRQPTVKTREQRAQEAQAFRSSGFPRRDIAELMGISLEELNELMPVKTLPQPSFALPVSSPAE